MVLLNDFVCQWSEIHGELTRARAFAAREVSRPIHPYLLDAEIATVVDACNNWRPA